MNSIYEGNPFKITTPEDLTAKEASDLFVDVFTDFSQITDPGHVILKGPRGVGKSMMFRYLQPDCQCLKTGKSICELPYVAVYIPLKNTNFMLTELRRFENKHASVILNEHLMVTHCLSRVLDNLIGSDCFNNNLKYYNIKKYYHDYFVKTLRLSDNKPREDTTLGFLTLMLSQIKEIYNETIMYIKKIAFSSDIQPYTGVLYDYIDYLVPILEALSSALSDVSATFYLLFDDAHCLSETQTRILNSWVSTRTSKKVSIKISTQYNYKTYYTTVGSTIDSPHDYVEIDIATVYTEGQSNQKGTYHSRIYGIVQKRMVLFGLDSDPKSFFPCDEKQENRIKEIEEYYKKEYDEGRGRGHNRTDDSIRYARPDFIKALAGKSKSSNTYSYSGFDQLVNISSGVVRYFLQLAHVMYAREQACSSSNVLSIKPEIQSSVVREAANSFLFNDLEVLQLEGHEVAYPKDDIQKLSNLIQGLGGLFRKILLSDRSERRVFSIAISNQPSSEVSRVLDIGILLGYFHKSTIGRKESGSIGRTRLYVLNRMLAPIWNLDPNGFAGYYFVRNELLERLIQDPITTIRNTSVEKEENVEQLSLFETDSIPSD